MQRSDQFSLAFSDYMSEDMPEVTEKNEVCLKVGEEFGRGSVVMTPVRPGMTILRSDLLFNRNIKLLNDCEQSESLWFFAYLAGNAKLIYENRYAQMAPGMSDVCVGGHDIAVHEEFRQKTTYRIVGLLLDPKVMTQIGGRSVHDLRKASHGPARMTPGMHAAASALFVEPDGYPDRSLFLEAKALEFLAYKMGQIDAAATVSPPPISNPRERIRHAAQILEKDMVDPPSVHELALSVGMSHTALIHGFKNLFASTPYAFLAELRLAKAATMIDGGATVTDAAFGVGYSNLSHFARIFKQRYGVNPGSYR